jgi:hypothetical protein
VVATGLMQPLVGSNLDQLCIGAGEVQLRLSGGHCVQLEAPVTVGDSVGVSAHGLDGLALLLPLLNEDVAAVAVDGAGGLHLTVGTTTLQCAAGPSFESWNVSGPAGLLVVSTPGGGLTIWSD